MTSLAKEYQLGKEPSYGKGGGYVDKGRASSRVGHSLSVLRGIEKTNTQHPGSF